jgi:hypothetical protein
METLGDIFVAKSSEKVASDFYCKKCDYKCNRKFNWNKHLLTSKHNREQQVTLGDNFVANVAKSSKIPCIYSCEFCKKEYGSRNGLWKHKKFCLSPIISNKQKDDDNDDDNDNDNDDDHDNDDDEISMKQLILLMLQQNNKVQDALIEMSKQISMTNSNNTSNTNNNSHNQTTNNNSFNLQFFLNETCKNAMNITDFANSIKLQLSDLISVGELGYVEGISNIIVKNLNALDITQRPVHCTDKKRETIYIKDADKWEKDEDDKKLKKFIRTIAFKNQNLFPKFKEKYPDYNDSESIHSDQYSKIVIESLDDSNPEKQEKIIKNISKAVTIDAIKNKHI